MKEVYNGELYIGMNCLYKFIEFYFGSLKRVERRKEKIIRFLRNDKR